MSRYRRTAGGSAVLGLFLSSATPAAGLETRVETVAIPVSVSPLVTTAEKYPVNSTYWPCPLNARGTAPNPASPGFMRVGWAHTFDSGTPPFPCQYRINHVQRVHATFDLTRVKKDLPTAFVRSAKLSFDKRRVAGDHECNDQLVTVVPGGAPIPPNVEERWDLPVPKLASADCVGARCTVDIKGQVNEWIKGGTPELGLVLRGDQERLDANDNIACLTEYANLKLDVTYAHDVAPGTLVTPILKPGLLVALIGLEVVLDRRTASEAIYALRWTDTGAGSVDIYRDGAIVVPATPNDGAHRDRAPLGTVRYKVCKAGTTNCSREVTVTS